MLRTATACALFRHLNFQKCSEHGFVHFDLDMCFAPQQHSLLLTSQLPTVLRAWCALCILTWKCASRHSVVHFFDISTSKSLPSMVCFVHFELETCFSPQLRALFRHLDFSKRSLSMVRFVHFDPTYFPRFSFRPPCRRFHLAPSQRSSPQAISHGFPSVHHIIASISHGSPYRCFHLPPSQRSSPHAIISHGFPSVHHIVACISLLPNGALPMLFPTVE